LIESMSKSLWPEMEFSLLCLLIEPETSDKYRDDFLL